MLDYGKLSKKPRSFQSFTGVTVQQFDFLSQKIESEYRGTEEKRLQKKEAKRDRCRTSLQTISQKPDPDVSDVLQDVHKL